MSKKRKVKWVKLGDTNLGEISPRRKAISEHEVVVEIDLRPPPLVSK